MRQEFVRTKCPHRHMLLPILRDSKTLVKNDDASVPGEKRQYQHENQRHHNHEYYCLFHNDVYLLLIIAHDTAFSSALPPRPLPRPSSDGLLGQASQVPLPNAPRVPSRGREDILSGFLIVLSPERTFYHHELTHKV